MVRRVAAIAMAQGGLLLLPAPLEPQETGSRTEAGFITQLELDCWLALTINGLGYLVAGFQTYRCLLQQAVLFRPTVKGQCSTSY